MLGQVLWVDGMGSSTDTFNLLWYQFSWQYTLIDARRDLGSIVKHGLYANLDLLIRLGDLQDFIHLDTCTLHSLASLTPSENFPMIPGCCLMTQRYRQLQAAKYHHEICTTRLYLLCCPHDVN